MYTITPYGIVQKLTPGDYSISYQADFLCKSKGNQLQEC